MHFDSIYFCAEKRRKTKNSFPSFFSDYVKIFSHNLSNLFHYSILTPNLQISAAMPLFRPVLSLFYLLPIIFLPSFCSAADPYASYEFRVSYITASPLGVPQKVLSLSLSLLLQLSIFILSVSSCVWFLSLCYSVFLFRCMPLYWGVVLIIFWCLILRSDLELEVLTIRSLFSWSLCADGFYFILFSSIESYLTRKKKWIPVNFYFYFCSNIVNFCWIFWILKFYLPGRGVRDIERI